jgi:putative flippase GtrA
MKKFVDIKLLKFILVGILNTIFSAVIMVMLYNIAGFGYWSSSAVSYVLGSILSFILNKNYTFNSDTPLIISGLKFALNIIICYLVAYSMAKPIVEILLSKTAFDAKITDQISMLFGMVLFTGLNYFGQRFFAFKDTKKD